MFDSDDSHNLVCLHMSKFTLSEQELHNFYATAIEILFNHRPKYPDTNEILDELHKPPYNCSIEQEGDRFAIRTWIGYPQVEGDPNRRHCLLRALAIVLGQRKDSKTYTVIWGASIPTYHLVTSTMTNRVVQEFINPFEETYRGRLLVRSLHRVGQQLHEWRNNPSEDYPHVVYGGQTFKGYMATTCTKYYWIGTTQLEIVYMTDSGTIASVDFRTTLPLQELCELLSNIVGKPISVDAIALYLPRNN